MDNGKLTEIAKWLGREEDAIKIQRLNYLAQEGRYYVTVWGHYSAGKSRLLNNILEKDILPVKSRETTAVLTYLQYGEEEGCRIFFDDGTSGLYDIEKVKEIFQNSEEKETLQKVDYIEVSVDAEILKSGIVLVDTPGVNTVIQKHRDLAVEALDQSGKILYVLGGSPSNVDKTFIRQITDCGIEIIFVRTKCDQFTATEENAEISLREEQNILKQIVEKNVTFIPVSNEKNNKWNENIKDVCEVVKEIANNLSKEMEQSLENRFSIYRTAYQNELKTEKERLDGLIRGESDAVKKEIEESEKDLKCLEDADGDFVKQIDDKVKTAKREAERDIETYVDNRAQKFERQMEGIPYSREAVDEIRIQYQENLSDSIKEIKVRLSSYADDILMKNGQELGDLAQRYEFMISPPSYDEVQYNNDRMTELLRARLEACKEGLEKDKSEKQELVVAGKELEDSYDEEDIEAALEALNTALAMVPTDTPLRVSANQGIRPSDVFRTVGQGIDLALLLLPGEAVVEGIKGAADAFKLTTKVGQELNKAGRVVKAVNSVDHVRDIAYVFNTAMNGRKYSTKKNRETAKKLVDQAAQKAGESYENLKKGRKAGTVLDMLSVAYWTEKIGAHFDPPLKMEVDTAEEDERNRTRREIQVQQAKLSEERIQKKKERNLIATRERELEEREREKIRQINEIETEMERRKEEVHRGAQEKALNKFKREYQSYYEASLQKAKESMLTEYFDVVGRNIAIYVADRNAELRRCITDKKSQLASLLELQKTGTADLQNRLSECMQYLQEMRPAS